MFKVGDMVYVAFAVGWKFETHLTTVKDVVEKDGEVEYIVECYCDAARFSNDMFEPYDDSRKENEIFEATKEGKAKCDKYVSDYYYDGLCRGCEYENFGSVFRCTDCSHCKDMGHKNPTDPRPMKCVLNKIVVGGFYIKSHAHEICKYFEKGRNGLPKKECLPIYQSFEGLAKIDIKKGILIDGQPIKTL